MADGLWSSGALTGAAPVCTSGGWTEALLSVLAGLAAAAAITALLVTVTRRMAARRHRFVAAQRPGWRLREGMTTPSQVAALRADGKRIVGTQAVTFAYDDHGFELWTGSRRPHVLVAGQWSEVVDVTVVVVPTTRAMLPALHLALRDGSAQDVQLLGRAAGSLRPASHAATAEAAAELRALAASATTTR